MSETHVEGGESDLSCNTAPASPRVALLWTGYFLFTVGYLLVRMLGES